MMELDICAHCEFHKFHFNVVTYLFWKPILKVLLFSGCARKNGQPPNNHHIFLVITFRPKGKRESVYFHKVSMCHM